MNEPKKSRFKVIQGGKATLKSSAEAIIARFKQRVAELPKDAKFDEVAEKLYGNCTPEEIDVIAKYIVTKAEEENRKLWKDGHYPARPMIPNDTRYR